MQKQRIPTTKQIGRKSAEIRKGWPEPERLRRAEIARRCLAMLALLPDARFAATH
jgi:hypothetical protein